MSDQTILITGANRGIGLELSKQFAADGWTVLACCRNPADAEALQMLGSRYPAIEVHALEVTDYAQMSLLTALLCDRSIDILLSNAGIYGPRGANFGDVDAAAWREVFEVNSIAPMMLAQAFVDQVAASSQKLVAVMSSKMACFTAAISLPGRIRRA